jgi:hypothetical protein
MAVTGNQDASRQHVECGSLLTSSFKRPPLFVARACPALFLESKRARGVVAARPGKPGRQTAGASSRTPHGSKADGEKVPVQT